MLAGGEEMDFIMEEQEGLDDILKYPSGCCALFPSFSLTQQKQLINFRMNSVFALRIPALTSILSSSTLPGDLSVVGVPPCG